MHNLENVEKSRFSISEKWLVRFCTGLNTRIRVFWGRVFVKFVVKKDGSTCNHEIVRGVNPDLDQAALQTVKKSPVPPDILILSSEILLQQSASLLYACSCFSIFVWFKEDEDYPNAETSMWEVNQEEKIYTFKINGTVYSLWAAIKEVPAWLLFPNKWLFHPHSEFSQQFLTFFRTFFYNIFFFSAQAVRLILGYNFYRFHCKILFSLSSLCPDFSF